MRLNFEHKRNWLKTQAENGFEKKIKPEEDSVLISAFLCQGEIKNEKIQFTKVFFKKYCECTKIYDV